MTNEEKARELAIKFTKDVDANGKEIYNIFTESALLQMAKWKDENSKRMVGDNCRIDIAKKIYEETDSLPVSTTSTILKRSLKKLEFERKRKEIYTFIEYNQDITE